MAQEHCPRCTGPAFPMREWTQSKRAAVKRGKMLYRCGRCGYIYGVRRIIAAEGGEP